MLKIPIPALLCLFLSSCGQSQNAAPMPPIHYIEQSSTPQTTSLIDTRGKTIGTRFLLPENFERTEVDPNSFANYLRNLPLKPADAEVNYYDGRVKHKRDVYEAVIDMDLDNRNLQQCADAVIRLRAEYLYGSGRYDEISFQFTNGFKADFNTWRSGHRIVVDGNNVSWRPSTVSSGSYSSFRNYLNMVFAYAGTYSVARETTPVPVEEIQLGDIFIRAGSPGHTVIVVDVAEHKENGEKIFLLAQSYMPAQDIQVLQNPKNGPGNPWYDIDFTRLYTPEWTFSREELRRF